MTPDDAPHCGPSGDKPAPLTPEQIARTIDLTVPRLACDRHREPFRAKWPAGWAVFSLAGMDKLLGLESFHKEVEATGLGSFPRAVEQLLDARPMCCRLARGVLIEVYKLCNDNRPDPVFVDGNCGFCYRRKLGGPYRLSMPGGTIQHIPHVCLECIIYNMEAR